MIQQIRSQGGLARVANYRLRSACMMLAKNLITSHPYYRGLSTYWEKQKVNSRDRHVRITNRMVFQIVGGRQVWRSNGVDREAILSKLREFHRDHHSDLDQMITDMTAAFAWLPKSTYASEAKPLAESAEVSMGSSKSEHLNQSLCHLVERELAQPNRVIVFTRYPEPGVTKTRLIPAIGPELAAQVQESLTKQTLRAASSHCTTNACDLEVRFAGGDRVKMQDRFGLEPEYRPQSDGGLGDRLASAFQSAFDEGAERIVVIGSDCPDIEAGVLHAALNSLIRSDVVLGPAFDGGYYLVGLRSPNSLLFERIDWGTDQVLKQTIEKANQTGLTVHRLKTLSDVDYPEDLIALRRRANEFENLLPRSRTGLLSVIVPTLNEERNIGQAITPLLGFEDVEVIVADGGSDDATVEIAHRLGARVVASAPGRGRQMNAGAAMAGGDVLLFLHADSTLPDDFKEQVRATLNSKVVAGAFRLSIHSSHPGLRLIEWAVNMRSRYLQMPYGDQGVFVASSCFYRINGFRNWPLMEDVDLCRRLRKRGKIGLANSVVRTSARRWLRLGLWRTTLVNQLCIAGFCLGMAPETLSRWYRSRG